MLKKSNDSFQFIVNFSKNTMQWVYSIQIKVKYIEK